MPQVTHLFCRELQMPQYELAETYRIVQDGVMRRPLRAPHAGPATGRRNSVPRDPRRRAQQRGMEQRRKPLSAPLRRQLRLARRGPLDAKLRRELWEPSRPRDKEDARLPPGERSHLGRGTDRTRPPRTADTQNSPRCELRLLGLQD